EAECSLAGTWFAAYRHTGTSCADQLEDHEKFAFRWEDFDGDGRTDLLVMLYTDLQKSPKPNCTLTGGGGHFGGMDPAPDGGPLVRDWGREACCDSDYYSYAETCSGGLNPVGGYRWRFFRNIDGQIQGGSSGTAQWCIPVTMEGDAPRRLTG